MKALRPLLPFGILLYMCAAPALAEQVVEVWRGGGFRLVGHLCVNPADGSCWVGHTLGLVHLAEDGTELYRRDSGSPFSLSVNPVDGSCWMCDYPDLVHVAADGAELWRTEQYSARTVSVNPSDGSCWTGGSGGVRHLDEDGTELVHVASFLDVVSVSVDPVDGSCWAAGTQGGEVAHLAVDGTEMWREEGFDGPSLVCVNATDGSCWVVDGHFHYAVHLAADGTELLRTGEAEFVQITSISVNPADSSIWVADSVREQVAHLAEDGTELWRGGNFPDVQCVSVNPADGSCWVALRSDGEVVHLVIASPFSDVGIEHWARDEIVACVNAGVVSGYGDGTYQPGNPVTRDQMAVYISRALAGGDENVPDFTDTPTFPDVGDTHWALKYVEYAVSCSVVGGYLDGTYHPEYPVTRDQMAVYVARSICDPTGEDGLADYVPADPRNFPDVSSGFWSYKHVEYCVENGVVSGYLDGLYHPEVVVTRDQMAVYVARAFGLMP
jgi:hypothetical protein